MNKKIVIISILGVLILGVAIFFISKNINNNGSDNANTGKNESKSNSIENYETDNFKKIKMDELDGKIIDICHRDSDSRDTWILSSEHKLYKSNYMTGFVLYVRDVNNNAKKFEKRIEDCIVISNSDGTYSFYKENANVSYENIKIEGKLVHAFFSDSEEDLLSFTLKDSKMYCTEYDAESKEKLIDNKLVNISLERKSGKEFHNDGIADYYNYNGGTIVRLSNGNLDLISKESSFSYKKDTDTYDISDNSRGPSLAQLSDFEKSYGLQDEQIIYSTKVDENNIYKIDIFDWSEKNIKKVELPSGYKTEDINRILFCNNQMLIEMNDKSVFYNTGKNTDEFKLLKDVTELNKKNKIKNFEFMDWNMLVALCDDGCVYDINIHNI